jgi:starch phosphorylase
MDWDKAWKITQQTMAYTNHTLLPEALEKWSLPLFSRTLPRHLEIIYEINSRFLDEVRLRFPGDDGRAARLSIIDESGDKYVRMAHLASVGSHGIVIAACAPIFSEDGTERSVRHLSRTFVT